MSTATATATSLLLVTGWKWYDCSTMATVTMAGGLYSATGVEEKWPRSCAVSVWVMRVGGSNRDDDDDDDDDYDDGDDDDEDDGDGDDDDGE